MTIDNIFTANFIKRCEDAQKAENLGMSLALLKEAIGSLMDMWRYTKDPRAYIASHILIPLYNLLKTIISDVTWEEKGMELMKEYIKLCMKYRGILEIPFAKTTIKTLADALEDSMRLEEELLIIRQSIETK